MNWIEDIYEKLIKPCIGINSTDDFDYYTEALCLEIGCIPTNKIENTLTKSLTYEILSKPPKGYSFETSLKEFTVVKYLSSGRFGSTYLTAHVKTDKFVGITIYHKSLLSDVFQQHIPFREKKLIENLEYPYINKLLGALSDQNSLYFLYDCQSITTLSSYMYQCVQFGGLGENLCVYIAACILSTLKYCHSKHILHRGLHPDSILLDWKGNIKITDWAFSKLVEERTYTLCGHVDYLSPEALLGETGYGKGLDYWALGVLIFEMLVGRSPFVPVESQWEQLERERGGAGFKKHKEVSSNHNLGLLDDSTHSVMNTSTSSASISGSISSSSNHNNNNNQQYQPSMNTKQFDLQTIENILYTEPHFPIHLPHSSKSIVKGLCTKTVSQRLGCKRKDGFDEISSQQWFRQSSIDWKLVEKGTMSCPSLPVPIELPNNVRVIDLPSICQTNNLPLYHGYNFPDWNEFETCSFHKMQLKSNQSKSNNLQQQQQQKQQQQQRPNIPARYRSRNSMMATETCR